MYPYRNRKSRRDYVYLRRYLSYEGERGEEKVGQKREKGERDDV